MGRFRTWFLLGLLILTLAVIVLTWGSIGSAVLTLALLLSGVYVLMLKIMENRNPDDFDWEG